MVRGFLDTYWFNARAVGRNSGQFKAPFNEINNEALKTCKHVAADSPRLQPASGKARPTQTGHDRRTMAHDVPQQPGAVILDHQHHRPLVDAEVIRRNPPAGRAVFHCEGLIERRQEPVLPVMPRSSWAKWRTAGMTISGAKGSEATTTQGATVPSSGPKGAPRAV